MIREEAVRPLREKAVMLCKWAEGSFLIFTRSVNESLVRPSARARRARFIVSRSLQARVGSMRRGAAHWLNGEWEIGITW